MNATPARTGPKWFYKLYREFEFLSLRHAVWVAEKSGCSVRKIARNRRNSSTFALKLDQRKCRFRLCIVLLRPFSLQGRCAVRFQRLPSANAKRSRTDDVAKARRQTSPCFPESAHNSLQIARGSVALGCCPAAAASLAGRGRSIFQSTHRRLHFRNPGANCTQIVQIRLFAF